MAIGWMSLVVGAHARVRVEILYHAKQIKIGSLLGMLTCYTIEINHQDQEKKTMRKPTYISRALRLVYSI